MWVDSQSLTLSLVFGTIQKDHYGATAPSRIVRGLKTTVYSVFPSANPAFPTFFIGIFSELSLVKFLYASHQLTVCFHPTQSKTDGDNIQVIHKSK